jgi:glutathione S-transferase
MILGGMYELSIANKNYSSWSLRPWLLMRQLGVPFREQIVAFPDGGAWDVYRKISPSGRLPCLRNGEAVVWDSLGITEYLAERHPGVWPTDPTARAWARCATAEMHGGFTAIRNTCSMSCGLRVRLHQVSPALERDVFRLGELWNDGLGRFGGPFLAGAAFTAVDAFFAPIAFRAQTYGLAFDAASAAYMERILALPAMRSWYADGLAETWREADHEAEIQALGTVLEDLRARP